MKSPTVNVFFGVAWPGKKFAVIIRNKIRDILIMSYFKKGELLWDQAAIQILPNMTWRFTAYIESQLELFFAVAFLGKNLCQ